MTNKTMFKMGALIHFILFIIGAMGGGMDFVYGYLACFMFLLGVILFLLFILWVLDDDYSLYQNLDEKKEGDIND